MCRIDHEKGKASRGNSATMTMQRKGSFRSVPKVEEGDAPRQLSKVLGPIFWLTPTTASKYKVSIIVISWVLSGQQFNVIKYNKFGAKQERVIGLDSERIITVNRQSPMRYIKDVLKATTMLDKPRHFQIQFKDKTWRLESDYAGKLSAKITKFQRKL